MAEKKTKKVESEPVDAKEIEGEEFEETTEKTEKTEKTEEPLAAFEQRIAAARTKKFRIDYISTEAVKLVFDSEKNGYCVKTRGKAYSGLLRYLGMKNGDIVNFHTQDDIFKFLKKVDAKADLMAKLYDLSE